MLKYDISAHASYTYDVAARELVSYDTIDVIREKCEVVKRGFASIPCSSLGGMFFWELASDSREKESSLVQCANKALGPEKSAITNHIKYPFSRYGVIRESS